MKSMLEKIDLIKTIPMRVIGSYRGNLVNAYWGGGPQNLGDFLPPKLLKYYGLTPIKTPKKEIDKAEVLTIGSILNWVSQDYSGYIVGPGLMYDVKRDFYNAKIYLVRGALTRDRIGVPKYTPLGDPGLLIPLIYKRREMKKYKIGLVPHYVDKEDKRIKEIHKRFPKVVKLIDIQSKPINIISEIDKCEYILSSSLHGLIAADALGIPSGWILLSDKVEGNGFKFYDYSSALEANIKPGFLSGLENIAELIRLTREVGNKVIEIQSYLDTIFKDLVKEIKNNRK